MAKGNKIIVSAFPKGVFEELKIIGTPKPGTMLGIVPATALLSTGRFSYEPAGATAASGSRGMSADGDRIAFCVLLSDLDWGGGLQRDADTAFATGDGGMGYWPTYGEECNILYQNQTGTADDITIGDKGIVDDGTGKVLISTGAIEEEPWEFREALVDPTADALLWAKFNK